MSQRQSAFSVVIHTNDIIPQKEIKKPKNVKRKHSNCENKKSEGLSPKRQKADIKKVEKDSYNTRLKTESVKETRSTAKTNKNQTTTKVSTVKPKGRGKAGLTKNNDEFRRVTRSMKKP